MNKKLTVFIVIALLVVLAFTAQSNDTVFSPFVTQLRADVSGNTVRLFWQDSASIRGPITIYRSRQPITAKSSQLMTRGSEVRYGEQSFYDEVVEQGQWYYFVVASDVGRVPYEVVIPYNNTISVIIDGGSHQVSAISSMDLPKSTYPDRSEQPSGSSIAPQQPAYNLPPANAAANVPKGISGIRAESMQNGVVISFNSNEANKNPVLYRSSRPINTINDIYGAIVVGDRLTSPYVDNQALNGQYYYAVQYDEDIRAGRPNLIAGVNSTVNPAGMGENYGGNYGAYSSYAENSSISSPYTFSQAGTAPRGTYSVPETGAYSTVKTRAEISPEAAAAAAQLLNSPEYAPAVPKTGYSGVMEPRIFNEDLRAEPATEEDYALSVIARGSFFRKDWLAARTELAFFLSKPRSVAAASRAHFYLGQSFFFLGDMRTALSEFMLAHAVYPEDTAKWTQAALTKLGEK